jgi:hypothetical protein
VFWSCGACLEPEAIVACLKDVAMVGAPLWKIFPKQRTESDRRASLLDADQGTKIVATPVRASHFYRLVLRRELTTKSIHFDLRKFPPDLSFNGQFAAPFTAPAHGFPSAAP